MFENLYSVLKEYGAEVRNKYQDNLILSDHIAKGDLLNDAEYIINTDNISISVSLSLKDYYKYLETGTKPHWPPVNKILEWIKVKPVLPDPNRNGGKLPTPDQLAYLIGRKISEEGTKGTQDLHKAVKEINAKYEDKIIEAITKDIDDEFTKIFTQYFVS